MKTAKYTEKQILCGLQECWNNAIGNDESFDTETRIDRYLKENGVWDLIDLGNMFYVMERFFHFTCTEDEWKQLFGIDSSICSYEEWENLVGQHLTFGVLAQFIAEKTPLVSFNPVTIIDRECLLAGVFYGIQDVIKNISEDSKRFAPSTKIIDVLRGNSLEKFWTELRWITKHGVPELSATWKNTGELGYLVGLLGVPVGILIWLLTENTLSFLMIPFVCALIWWAFSTLYKNWVNPLPSEIITFRDLAMLIAAHDCDATQN